MDQKFDSFMEFTNQYPEFAWMHTALSPHKTAVASKKKLQAALRRFSAAAAKLSVLGAALAVTIIVSLTIRVSSTLIAISSTTADIHARVIAEREEDKEATIFYRLQRVIDSAVLETAFLPFNDMILSYDNLEPDTLYRLTYYAEASAKVTDQGGDPLEVVGRFEFTTLTEEELPGEGTGGGEIDSPRKGDPGQKPDDPSNEPPKESTPTPTASPTPTMTPVPVLEFVTTSLADGQELLSYEQALMIRYTGVNSVTFTLDGQLPAGLSFSPDGIFSGIPESGTKGTWSDLRVIATDSVTGLSAEITYSLLIAETKPLNITNRFLKETKQTYKYECQVTVDWEDSSTLQFSASGLPSGLSIDPDTGLISGMTTESTANGSYSVTVTAEDSVSPAKTSKVLELYVGLKPTPTPTPSPDKVTYYAREIGVEVGLPELGGGWETELSYATFYIYNHDNITARITGVRITGPESHSWSGTQTIAPGGSFSLDFPINSEGTYSFTITFTTETVQSSSGWKSESDTVGGSFTV